MDLNPTRALIERVIEQLGGDPEEQQMSEDAWILNHGSAIGYVALLQDKEDPDNVEVLVRFRIMTVPPKHEEKLFRKLLELNEALVGRAAFSLSEDGLISLQAGRPAQDLDESELVDVIGRTTLLADHYDDILLDEFGREYAPN